jgi:hypothetical protein
MKVPTQCALWTNPELTSGPLKERFDLIDTFVEESHHWRYLLKCRECGQRYFSEFHEEIDWEGGNDPQYSTWIPVDSDSEIETLKRTSPSELLQFAPRLQNDWPKDATSPTLRWVK